MRHYYARTITLIFIFTLSVCFRSMAASVIPPTTQPDQEITTHNLPKIHSEFSTEQKLSLKEKIAVKIAKKQLKKTHKKHRKTGESGKSQIVALLLCIFLGGLGIHRFYLGYTGMGLLYLFTVGLFGIGWLIDTILLIIPNGLTPKGRSRY